MNTQAHFNKGNCLKKLNRLEEALVAYDMTIKYNPTDSYANYLKGTCLKELDRLDEAKTCYDLALKHYPNS